MGSTARTLAVITAVLTIRVETTWIVAALIVCALGFVVLGVMFDGYAAKQQESAESTRPVPAPPPSSSYWS